jgi:hypothetical protein
MAKAMKQTLAEIKRGRWQDGARKANTMPKTKYNGEQQGKSIPKLKLAHLPKPPPRLRLGGMEPANDMPAGEYKISCEGASKKPFGDGWKIELKYRVIDGLYAGTALRQWIPVDASGILSPRSRYVTQAAIALGRPVGPEDNLDNPASIFVGKIFSAFVGFRKTEKPKGGKPADPMKRKDAADGLRVHELLGEEWL